MNLSEKIRPTALADILGQDHIIPTLDAMIKSGEVFSFVLYGPPATGKTTIGKIFANTLGMDIVSMDANFVTKKELTAAFDKAPIIIFMDEIHRLDKRQQELFLPQIEFNDVILIGATTESPYHELTPALRSRLHIMETKPLTEELRRTIIDRAKQEFPGKTFDPELEASLAKIDDIRTLLRTMEMIQSMNPGASVYTNDMLDALHLSPTLMGGNKDFLYSRKAALQKSIRGSNADATIYWLNQLLESGDIETVIRRFRIICYEDIGVADPSLWPEIEAACSSALAVGMPEARIPLAAAAVRMALAPKNNAAVAALGKAKALRQLPPPSHIASEHPPTYLYPHNYPFHWVYQEYMPDGLRDEHLFDDNLPDAMQKTYNSLNKNTEDARKALKAK